MYHVYRIFNFYFTESKGDCKACLKNRLPPKQVDSCPCLVVHKSKHRINCPCTVDEPPDSEAEPDLKSGDTGLKNTPCPTGPSGEAAGIMPSSASLDFKWENAQSEEVVSEVNLDKKIDKKEDKCNHRKNVDDRHKKKPHESHKPHPDTNPKHDLMQRFGLVDKVGRKRQKHHAAKAPEGQAHAKQPHAGRSRAKQPHTAHPRSGQPQAGCAPPEHHHAEKPHVEKPHAKQPPVAPCHENKPNEMTCGQPQCRLNSLQPQTGQPQNEPPHAGQPHDGCPQTGCPPGGQPHTEQPHEGQPHCRLPHCGLPHCGPPHCDPSHCLQHPCGQPQKGPIQCGPTKCGQPQCGQSHFGQSQCGPPSCGHPQCGKPYCGMPNCGQPLSCKPPHNVQDAAYKVAPASAHIEAGEAYKQVHNKQAKFHKNTVGTATESKFLCDCAAATGKKKKKVLCECPPQEAVLPVSMNNEFNWVDGAEINKMKSILTETTSGFKVNKKKRPPPEPEKPFNIEDAIRYYATLKPELFRNIVEEQDKQRQHEGKGAKGKKSEVQCICSAETATPARHSVPSLPSASETPRSDETQDEDAPFRGLKIRVGGKGSGSPGLTGICCFDMVQDSFTTW